MMINELKVPSITLLCEMVKNQLLEYIQGLYTEIPKILFIKY